jgi:hypothetical protein
MPHRRRVRKGSFKSHFDELVARFSEAETVPSPGDSPPKRPSRLQDKIDIHALLFARAWQAEDEG